MNLAERLRLTLRLSGVMALLGGTLPAGPPAGSEDWATVTDPEWGELTYLASNRDRETRIRMASFPTVFLGSVALMAGVGLLIGGRAMFRHPTRVHRVPIDGIVVHCPAYQKLTRVTFDYPAPDGRWLRATRSGGLVATSSQGLQIRPGDGIRVYVDPSNPVDVSLGEIGSAGGFLGFMMMFAGA